MTSASSDNETPAAPIFIGVDVGGTNIKIGFVSNDGEILHSGHIETQEELGPANAIERVAAEIKQVCAAKEISYDEIAAVGLGTPGTMDIPKGMILAPPNLPGWRYFPIRDALAEALGKPVAYTNDANAAAFGEYWLGSAQKYNSMVLLTLGTGVGGGVIISDWSIDGENSHGAEIGHSIVDTRPEARICGCGQSGHLEAYASATAVTKRTTEALAAGRVSSMQEIKNSGSVTALDVCQHAENGDALANEIILETADYLAVGILNVVHVIDPNAVVLGGAMNFGGDASSVGRKFIERIRTEVTRLTFPVIAENLKIEFATLGGEAGFVGAAGVARQMYKSQDSNAPTSQFA